MESTYGCSCAGCACAGGGSGGGGGGGGGGGRGDDRGASSSSDDAASAPVRSPSSSPQLVLLVDRPIFFEVTVVMAMAHLLGITMMWHRF